jgi:trehalose 6-phosphate synthase
MLQGEFNRLAVVSNRLPVVLQDQGDSWDIQPGSGGLVTALAPILSRNGGIWIGWPGTSAHGVEEPIREFSERQGYTLSPVPLSPEDVKGYYSGFSNEILWPLLHGFHTRCHFDPSYWACYQRVNGVFARQILQDTDPEDYVWVHDYHLMCVAREMKKTGASRNCGFFLHIPFPGPEIFLKLPWRREILRSLMDYDLLGFQTSQDARNFVRCLQCLSSHIHEEDLGALSLITCNDLQVKAGCFPISIDFDEFANKAASKDVSTRTATLNLLHPEQQIILGVDRLDYTKGIPQRLEAMRNALSMFPDLRGRISLIQVVVPSREGVSEYQLLKEEIERLVGEINGQFTEPGWIPIHYLYRSLPRRELIAFYLASAIALITPLWDGMNLVAKEYCACNYREDGMLILSEFAGAASQLHRDAILVNPYDVNGVADAIRRAFHMSKAERQARMANLRRVIKQYDIHFWVDSFLQAAFYDQARSCPLDGLGDYLPKIDQL